MQAQGAGVVLLVGQEGLECLVISQLPVPAGRSLDPGQDSSHLQSLIIAFLSHIIASEDIHSVLGVGFAAAGPCSLLLCCCCCSSGRVRLQPQQSR